MKIPYMTPDQLRRAKRLIRNECSNYDAEHNECFLLDEGDGCVCVQSISYSLLCRYFGESVLPLDEKLMLELLPPVNTKQCQICGREFVPTGRSSRYCKDCSARRRRQLERERKQRARSRKK